MKLKLSCLFFAIITILIVLTPSFCSQSKRSLLVTYSRTETLYKRCPTERVAFYNSQVNESQSWARKQTASSLDLNGDALIYAYLTNNTDQTAKQVSNRLGNIIIYVVFMVLGLAIMIIFGPIMICCCCNPDGCPPSQCCRNQNDLAKSSRKWPAAVIIFVSIIGTAAAIGILIVNPQLQKSYSETRCSTSIFFDDLINGNFTRNNSKYFVGLKPLKADLLTSPLTAPVSAPVSSPSNNKIVQQVISEAKTAQQQVNKLCNENKQDFKLSYTTPLNTAPSQALLSNSSTPSSIPQILKTFQNSLSSFLQTVQTLINYFFTLTPVGQVPSPLQKYANLATEVQDLDKNTDKKLQEVQDQYVSPLIIVTYTVAAIVILSSAVLIVPVLSICLCDKFQCRKLMYGLTALLTVMGVVTFILSILMSVGAVGSHYGCNYIDGGLETKAEFVYRFQPIFQNKVLTQLVAQCAARQATGIVVSSKLKESQSSSAYQNLSSTLSSLLKLSTNLTSTLTSHLNSQVIDIGSFEVEQLQKLSDESQYQCSSYGFSSDSWVPSIHQQAVYIPCKGNNLELVDNQTCTKEVFEGRGTGCQGCIDTAKVLGAYEGYEQVLAALNRRYPNADCQVFNEELSNVWSNFYLKKQQKIPPIIEKSKSLSSTINHLIDLSSQLTIAPQPTPVSSSSSASPAPTPVSATITQLSCKVLGEDIELILNTFCTQFFNSAFKLRILTITLSFCLFLVLFCGTCLGMRAYHSEQMMRQTKGLGSGSDHIMNNQSEHIHGYYSSNTAKY